MRNTSFSRYAPLAIVFTIACSSKPPGSLVGSGDMEDPSGGTGGSDTTGGTSGDGSTGAGASAPKTPTALDDRTLDYGEALRTASIKLLATPPTLAQIQYVATATNQKVAYEKTLDDMFADPRFATRMIKWWKDVYRSGGKAGNGNPSRDTAAIFTARTIVEEQPFTDVLTSTSNNCPTYDNAAMTFADGECMNNVPTEAGVLTNPGIQMQFFSNMAMRRVRWVQEVFDCTKFPAEIVPNPTAKGTGEYTSPWPFESVATAPINFQDTQSVICANCHTTINHIAPLFGHFDAQGMWSMDIQVVTPVAPTATPTVITDWLQPGEVTSWRHDQPVSDIAGLGAAMASDPAVTACVATRAYNFVFSKEDVVNDLATVPDSVLDKWITDYTTSNMNLKQTLRDLFASDDFVRF